MSHVIYTYAPFYGPYDENVCNDYAEPCDGFNYDEFPPYTHKCTDQCAVVPIGIVNGRAPFKVRTTSSSITEWDDLPF